MDSIGNIRGMGVGSALVTAIPLSVDGASSSAVVTVTEPPSCGEGIRTVVVPGVMAGALTVGDCVLADGRHHDVWSVSVDEAMDLEVTLTSSTFDAVLMLTDEGGHVLAWDDSSGSGLDARITFSVLPGDHQVVVTSSSPGEGGDYLLSVRCGGSTTFFQEPTLLSLRNGHRGRPLAPSGPESRAGEPERTGTSWSLWDSRSFEPLKSVDRELPGGTSLLVQPLDECHATQARESGPESPSL